MDERKKKRMRINDVRLSDNFYLYEFECPHCKCVKVSQELLDVLESLRRVLQNHPIIIASGYRCRQYNRDLYRRINVDRADRGLQPIPIPRKSIHTHGLAVDISPHVFTENDRETLHDLGFTGVGLGRGKTHLDVRSGDNIDWSYDD